MSSSQSGQRSRSYRMTKRAEAIESTRQKIVEATVALHGTVGPAATSVLGIAEKAGVTRATIYRHFPDEAALYQACSAHWLAQQVPPNPAAWAEYTDPYERMRIGLSDLYRFYRAGDSMLRRIYADKEWLPEEHGSGLDTRHALFCDALLSAFPTPQRRRHQLPAVVGHAVEFWTWRSLCVEQGLVEKKAVELMVQLAALAVGDLQI